MELPTEGRLVSESASEISELALPTHANPLGNLLGGRVMHLVDIAAALATFRDGPWQDKTRSMFGPT